MDQDQDPPPPNEAPDSWQGGQQPPYGAPPYGQQYPGGSAPGGVPYAAVDHPQGTAAFLLTLLPLVTCVLVPVGIIGLVMARGAQKEVRQRPGFFGNESLINAAVVLGWIDVALSIPWLLFVLLWVFALIGIFASAPFMEAPR